MNETPLGDPTVKSRERVQPSYLVEAWRRFSVTEKGMPIRSSLSLDTTGKKVFANRALKFR